ncbi:MAG TPA: tetratricopeptide repeat protein [Anaerolineae bacterium]|nr:tetratricopeptide repeat protein [Anaerolineae bacterium]HQH37950.1 tetratricopeptide repeat protein [Anaerolineae bacterium]
MSTYLAQAELLLQRARYQDAEALLRRALAEDPTVAEAHTLLAFALLYQGHETDALLEAQAAVRFAPDNPAGHYAGAIVLTEMGKYDEALSAIRSAIRLIPEVPRYHAVMGNIYLGQREWQKALDAAETGLRFDSENIQCNNVRAMALVKLGRQDEAGQSLEAILALNPENAMTHANRGWTLLHSGQHEQALEHFREALRLNPQLEWAREGIVEALKARNPIYWVMLRYFLWMSRLSGGARWGLILGVYFLNRAASALTTIYPGLALIFLPLNILYILFVFLSWTARPLFNLLLRFNRMGRLALSDEDIVASNWVAVCLLAAVGFLGAGLFLRQSPFLTAALNMLMLVVPVASLFDFRAGKRRWFLIAYTAGLALLAVGSLIFKLNGAAWGAPLGEAFIWGWILYSWIANAIATQLR